MNFVIPQVLRAKLNKNLIILMGKTLKISDFIEKPHFFQLILAYQNYVSQAYFSNKSSILYISQSIHQNTILMLGEIH